MLSDAESVDGCYTICLGLLLMMIHGTILNPSFEHSIWSCCTVYASIISEFLDNSSAHNGPLPSRALGVLVAFPCGNGYLWCNIDKYRLMTYICSFQKPRLTRVCFLSRIKKALTPFTCIVFTGVKEIPAQSLAVTS